MIKAGGQECVGLKKIYTHTHIYMREAEGDIRKEREREKKMFKHIQKRSAGRLLHCTAHTLPHAPHH